MSSQVTQRNGTLHLDSQPLMCSRCGKPIRVGDRFAYFAVGVDKRWLVRHEDRNCA